MHLAEADHQSARMVGTKRSVRKMSAELPKPPADYFCELQKVLSPTLSEV